VFSDERGINDAQRLFGCQSRYEPNTLGQISVTADTPKQADDHLVEMMAAQAAVGVGAEPGAGIVWACATTEEKMTSEAACAGDTACSHIPSATDPVPKPLVNAPAAAMMVAVVIIMRRSYTVPRRGETNGLRRAVAGVPPG
jgi:hypothetical protein